ncbi:MAG TPA: hypothetical protein VHG91_19895, partial [Longimicrobium sp.]|nr:hypothetical protein [Longimicrobium sp.]
SAPDSLSPTPGADVTEQGGAVAVTVQLAGLGGSTATGTANVLDNGDGRTQIGLTVNGAAPGERAAHVHEGTCEQLGAPVGALQTVSVTGAGSATAVVSAIDLPPATVMDGRHAISVHEPNGNPGAPEICGNIPARTR